eukprot:524879-Pelagomonas_calceolata.AAC.11
MFSACPSALFPNAHPAFPFKHTQVERLVVSGAADPQVQSLPEAALMLATPESAISSRLPPQRCDLIPEVLSAPAKCMTAGVAACVCVCACTSVRVYEYVCASF